MRLGTSTPLAYDNAESWAQAQTKLGCGAVVFPVQNHANPMNPVPIDRNPVHGFSVGKDLPDALLHFEAGGRALGCFSAVNVAR